MNDVILISGPNGAGKTKTAGKLLPGRLGIIEFVNADEIARGLSPFNVEGAAMAAGRIMLRRIEQLIVGGQSFAFETTCAGQSQHRLLERCRRDGWRITVPFLWLPSTDDAISRVARRVREGGHSIPSETVRRRFRAGIRNLLRLYLPIADIASIYDNSDGGPHLVADRMGATDLRIVDPRRWQMLMDGAL